MGPDLQIALWGLAAIVPALLSVMTRRDADALGIAGMILFIWLFSRVCWIVWTPPEAMQFYPLLDAVAGITTFTAWLTRRAWWKLALTCLYVGQCAAHLSFWVAYPAPDSLLYYEVVLNFTFALQLLCAGWPGGSYVVARLVGWGLSRNARRRNHARA